MNSVRLLNFGIEYPQFQKDASIFRSGKKRFGDFKNKISISMLSSIPVYELEKTLANNLKESRRYLKEERTKRHNFGKAESQGAGQDLVIRSPNNGNCYFNENLKEVYPKGRFASVGRNMRMVNYGMNILK